MDIVILGFLMIRSLTQYDLLQALQKKVSPFYKASLGSIQHALKNLLERGHIITEQLDKDPRKKLLYHITPSGRCHFLQWMLQEPDENKLEAHISTKLFFMGHLSKVEKIEVIKTIINCLEKITATYKIEKSKYDSMKWDDNLMSIIHYQLKTLDLAYDSYSSTLRWFKKLLTQEESR